MMVVPEVPTYTPPAENTFDSNGESQSVPVDPYRSIVRLLVGGSVELVAAFRQLLEEGEAAQVSLPAERSPQSSESAEDQALYVALALLFASAETARRGARRVFRVAGKAGNLGLRMLSPARKMLGGWVSNHETDLEQWIAVGRVESRRSRGVARYVAGNTVSLVVDGLNGSPTIDGLLQVALGNYQRYLKENSEDTDQLVQAVAANYLAYLQEHPEQVEVLIRAQGNQYIEYLNKNPEMVQDLVTGQSTGLASEMVEEVRERTVSADNVFEMITRSIMRRTPREELPEPPPEVQRRAERAILPSDLKPTEVDQDASQ